MGGIPPLIVDEPALAAADRSCKIGGVPSTVHLICTNRTTHSEGSTIGVDSRKRRRPDGRSSESPPRECCEAKRAENRDLCEAELARRSGTRTGRPNSYKQTHVDETVHGFHFVCPTEKESREIQMGRFGLELGWSTKTTRNVRRRSEDTLLCTPASPNRQGDGSGEKGYFYGERSSSDP